MQLSHSEGDHCNPAVAIDSMGVLYAVWQENARGVWNVCVSVSGDGLQWSKPVPIVDSNDNQVNPAIAAGVQPSGLVAVAWQSDAGGNQDIHVAGSTDAFATAEIARVTTDEADQVDPAVAIDVEDSIFVLWTDARNASSDIYGAASGGAWANVPVVNIDSNQSQPAVAIGSTGLLHVTWVDDLGGDADVFYASSEGLPASPLAGVDLIDDASHAEQRSPAVAAVAAEDGTERVLVCWVDGRNGNTDLCLADVSPDSPRASVRVGNNGVASNRDEVGLATAPAGGLYMVWTDDAAGARQVYCTAVEPAQPETPREEQGELPGDLS